MYIAMGVPRRDARKLVESLYDMAKEEAEHEGTSALPGNFGEIVLGQATTTDPGVAKAADHIRGGLEAARADGATDADIRNWWSLPDVERRMRIKVEENATMALFTGRLRKGASKEAAWAAVIRSRAVYGVAGSTSWGTPWHWPGATPDDRPLPY